MTTDRPRDLHSDATRPVPTGDPRKLGRYELGERLGEGGMGVVWRAVAQDDDREVAIKVLREHIAHDSYARERLRREVHTLARVHHPRIAAVIDADVDGPAPYIVTEYVPGPPLDQVVAKDGPIKGEALLRLGRGLAEALHAIHAAGIVHRDLKPGNVLMVGDDPVVIDFGIAQVADDVRLTMTGMVMGTPGYLSPEVVEGGEVSEATDWWGWAATLAYAASGQPPFGRGPMTVVLDRVIRGRLQLDGVDPLLQPLLAAALDPDPIRRPTETQVLDAMERYARAEDVTGALTVHQPAPVDQTRMHEQTPQTRVAPIPAPRPSERDRPRGWDPAGQPGAAGQQPGPAAFAGQHYAQPAAGEHEQALRGQQGAGPEGQLPPTRPDPRIGRSARSGTLSALLLLFVGISCAVPLLAWGLFAAWSVLARTVDRSITSLVLRRHEAGHRRSDVPVLVLSSPWHMVTATLGTVLALLLPGALAVVTAIAFSGLVSTTELMVGVGPDHPLAMGLGSLTGAWMAWWGLAGTSLRRGSRTIVRGALPAGTGAGAVSLLLIVAGLALGVWAVLEGDTVTWWPLPADLDPRDLLPVLR